MYWFLLLFPLLIYPWGYDPIFTTPKPFYLQMFVFLTWLYIILKKKYKTIELDKNRYKIEIMLTVFIAVICVSTVFSINQMTSLYGTTNRSEGLFTFIAYFSILHFAYRFLNEKHLQKILPGIILVSIFVSVYGILQHYLLDFLPRSSGRIGYERSYAFFGNPNFFGSYLVLIMMVGTTLYLTSKTRRSSLFFMVAVSLAFVALIFTGTRSGYVGIFIAFLFITIMVVSTRRQLWGKWAALGAVLASLVLLIQFAGQENYSGRVNNAVKDAYKIVSKQSTGHEGSSRLFIWEESLPLVKEHFWIGSGPDTFRYVFPATPEEREEFLGNPRMIVDKAHNEYLQIAVTLGTPALIVYLALLFIVVKNAFQAARIAPEQEKILLYGLVSAILGYLAQAFFNISVVSVAPFFWALLGITLALSAKQIKAARQTTGGEDSISKNSKSA